MLHNQDLLWIREAEVSVQSASPNNSKLKVQAKINLVKNIF